MLRTVVRGCRPWSAIPLPLIGLAWRQPFTIETMASADALDELRRIQQRVNERCTAITDSIKNMPGKGFDVTGVTQVMGTMLRDLPEDRNRVAEKYLLEDTLGSNDTLDHLMYIVNEGQRHYSVDWTKQRLAYAISTVVRREALAMTQGPGD